MTSRGTEARLSRFRRSARPVERVGQRRRYIAPLRWSRKPYRERRSPGRVIEAPQDASASLRGGFCLDTEKTAGSTDTFARLVHVEEEHPITPIKPAKLLAGRQ